MQSKILGVIGGSGLYNLGIPTEKLSVETPYGPPSSAIQKAVLHGTTLYFIARHGEGHTILPSELNSRANIFALKKLGAKMVLSVSAVGSLRQEITPGDFVLPDQYLDLTRGRPSTYFGEGVVGHAHFADPACHALRAVLEDSLKKLSIKVHTGGTYVCMEGPQFSTRAESHWYRSWPLGERQAVVIGMTALPEARLAREARLCYHTVAMATDYDCWNAAGGDVSVEAIIKVLKSNVGNSQRLISALAEHPLEPCGNCWRAMEHAVMTPKELWPKSRLSALETILE